MSSTGNANYESASFPHPKYENLDLKAHMEALKKTDEALKKEAGQGKGSGGGGEGEGKKERGERGRK
ncbi:hypothetical protein K440DRAFT_615560 [Wilcoxina mikolae CBS 423.85]|nr:hypothetical protein K440DRAFT_615560 [Wilcoxina mikolae CBS 423.85]